MARCLQRTVLAVLGAWATLAHADEARESSFFDENRVKPVFDGKVVDITPDNLNDVTTKWHYLFIEFFADWCPYCRRLKPVWEQASSDLAGIEDAAFAVLDCVAHPEIALSFGITKFPTMKMMRAGKMSKNEYRAARTAPAIKEFFHSQVDEESNHASTIDALENFVEEGDKRIIVGFFTKGERDTSESRKLFEKISDHMRDDCKFIEVHDPEVMEAYNAIDGTILYKTDHDHALDEKFVPSKHNEPSMEELTTWAYEKCVPLVKEATRDNIESLAEEGKPFFIMFYDDTQDDGTSVRIFKQAIEARFKKERETFNFLYADGNTFYHPLEHMGVTRSDLPVVAIDTFRHMYRFKNFNCFAVPETLQRFVDDFKSGKMHDLMIHGKSDPYSCDEELNKISQSKDSLQQQLEEHYADMEDGELEDSVKAQGQVADLTHKMLLAEKHEDDKEELRELAKNHGLDPAEIEKEMDSRVHESVFVKLKPGAGSDRYSMRDEL